jgi:outer membrane protein assembly factor BamD (BamD/ComL family)
MGRKQIRTGKHLLFCYAGLIFLFLNGCAFLEKFQDPDHQDISTVEKEKIRLKEAAVAEEKKKEETAWFHLLKGRKLFAQGDFEGALLENQMITTFFPERSAAEEALFMLGLINAHPGNPKKDFAKALDFLKRMVKEYPNSFFGQQAKGWIGLLLMNEKAGKENEKLIKDHEKLIKEYEKMIKEYEKMSRMLEEYKQVDIEIEGKKREKGR